MVPLATSSTIATKRLNALLVSIFLERKASAPHAHAATSQAAFDANSPTNTPAKQTMTRFQRFFDELNMTPNVKYMPM